MGTIIGRSRKDGSKAFTAQIVIKKDGVIIHREAQTFDRKPAANAWIVKREAELKRPGGLERKEDPTLAAVIDRYISESKNAVHGTKAQVLKTLKSSDLGEITCSEITSRTLARARGRWRKSGSTKSKRCVAIPRRRFSSNNGAACGKRLPVACTVIELSTRCRFVYPLHNDPAAEGKVS